MESFIITIILSVMFIGVSSGFINDLNSTEYDKMPPRFLMDPYERCLNQPGGVYCSVDMNLVSDEPNPLLEMITEYSANKNKHFNYTKLQRGICLTQSCKKFYGNTTVDQRDILEACLNESLWNTYHLKVKLSDDFSCHSIRREINIDTGDIVAAVVFLMIVLANLVGSLYDFYFTTDNSKGIKLLLCFSLRQNWRKLVAPHTEAADSRLKRLKGFNGLKTISIFAVILYHSLLISAINVENPRFIEKTYDLAISYVLYNGHLLVQTFFIISAFMLTYNLQIYCEKNTFTAMAVPKGIMVRYLRLTPVYAVVLAFTSTWLRLTGSGPMWEEYVALEAKDCRRYWWMHMLYFNNNVQISQCMMQTWYVAADFQLHCIALLIMYVCQSNRSRKLILSTLLLVGILIPAIQTYIQDLDATLLTIPEFAYVFPKDTVLNTVYRNTHTNFACYVIGLGLGFFVYRHQKSAVEILKYKKYRFLYWAIVPAGAGLLMSGSIFYADGPRAPVLLRATYAGLAKPVFGIMLACIILGMIFKLENVYRGIIEWRGWTTLGRVSFGAYLVHFVFIKYTIGIHTTTTHLTIAETVEIFLGVLTFSYMAACCLWLLVEAPFGQVVKILFEPRKISDTSVLHQ